ncbi:hypothetical protein CBR_g34465 [Chara braunii]|uniref:Secreted protein n=1 Tax=Chara braunii TaxID=69332 RepID=A0A388LIW9_CHABU|nr:hypothetical protein CBR_g34465 [Chara braunii]|eukprot:GBG82183.1 hypothetical protein CBR_g34465 [Chara braunii]
MQVSTIALLLLPQATRAATQGGAPPAKANGDVVRSNEEPVDGQHPAALGSSLGTMDVASGSQRLGSGGTQTEQRNGREGHGGGGSSTRLAEREVGRSG